jgi:hypothetical protein
VEPSDEHKAVLRGLGNGECIFRDLDGRAGRIGVDLISAELTKLLDTNPTRARPDEVPTPPVPAPPVMVPAPVVPPPAMTPPAPGPVLGAGPPGGSPPPGPPRT